MFTGKFTLQVGVGSRVSEPADLAQVLRTVADTIEAGPALSRYAILSQCLVRTPGGDLVGNFKVRAS